MLAKLIELWREQFTAEENDYVDKLIAARGADTLQKLYQRFAQPEPVSRQWTDPTESDSNAWSVRTNIEGASEGLLAGKTVAIKDSIAVAGLPLRVGTKLFEGYLSSTDAEVVTRILAAGGNITGKSVCEYLCFTGTSHTAASGPIGNPYDKTCTAGGSSSGSAVLVSEGLVDLALGGDQGGSIRVPSALTGIVGLKPTFGLVPYTGAVGLETAIDHLGPMTATVSEAATLLQVIAGPDGQDPRQIHDYQVPDYSAGLEDEPEEVTLGLLSEGFGIADISNVAVDDLVQKVAEKFAKTYHGYRSEVSVPWHSKASIGSQAIFAAAAAYTVFPTAAIGLGLINVPDPQLLAVFHRNLLADPLAIPPLTRITAFAGQPIVEQGGVDYAYAKALVPKIREAYDEALETCDVLVLPTVPFVADKLPGDSTIEQMHDSGYLTNTLPFNLTGHPAITVPIGLVDGKPVGVMIVGKHYQDAQVLQVARMFEKVRGDFPKP